MSISAVYKEQLEKKQAFTQSIEQNPPTNNPLAPSAPGNWNELGLSTSFVSRLMMKHLYSKGVLSGLEIAKSVAIPFILIDSLLDDLLDRKYAEKRGGQGLGNSNDRFGLSERGMNYARDLLEQDSYSGPAPVPLDQYWMYICHKSVKNVPANEALLREAWKNYVVDEALFSKAGPAICSGKSCFLYGPPGTGKTFMAKKFAEFLDQYGNPFAIPHAVLVGGSVIRIYDMVHHENVEPNSPEYQSSVFQTDSYDKRWVVCKRPAVVVGGELTLDMLDLKFNPSTKYYEAPLQMKANGGVLIIDDFGRQLGRPKDLLNRWIVPLEERLDYLTLHTGKKFSIPFEQLVVFATNLNPKDLVDEAFLRRIRYKIFIGEPSFEVYRSIFAKECEKKDMEVDLDYLETLVEKYYRATKRPMRACDARDITDQIHDYCMFNEQPLKIPNEMLDRIAGDYLTEFSLTQN